MDEIRSKLLDMGFSEAKVERALSSCPEAKTLEQVMEWLITHDDEPGKDQTTTDNGPEASTNQTQSEDAKSKKKLTVDEAKQLISKKQAERAEEERRKAIEDEKRRRTDGQKMAETRQELKDQEMVRMAQLVKKEKQEKEAHRRQVLEQIARDREAMKNRNSTPSSSKPSPPTNSSSTCEVRSKEPATECRLALKFPDGSTVIHKLKPQDLLSAVRSQVEMEKNIVGVEFVMPPSKKMTESNMSESLESLGLCPASRLVVVYKRSGPDYPELNI